MRSSGAQIGLGGGLALLVCGAALLSLSGLAPSPTVMQVPLRLQPPSWSHPFGTDPYGRDVLAMVVAGARTALTVAAAASLLGLAVGVPLGLTAAVLGDGIEALLMRASDVVFAFPALLTAVLIAALSGPGLAAAIAAIGLFNIPVFARVTRASALSLLQRDFVLAARAGGQGAATIAWRHLLPNCAPLLLVQSSVQFSVAITAEAGLSYVGLGVQPPVPSWGRLLQQAQTMLDFAPWLAVFPGLAIVLTVLGFALLGDGLRQRLDPRRTGRLAS
jgi:peptide/nickel transport system permease protein